MQDWWDTVVVRGLKNWVFSFAMAMTCGASAILFYPQGLLMIPVTIGIALLYYTWLWWQHER